MKNYVIIASVDDGRYTPVKLTEWFNPEEMCHMFRLLDADGRFCFTVCLITHLRLNLKTTMRQFADAQPQSISTLSLMSGKSCDL